MTDLIQVAEQARDWISEKPELRPCSAGKMVGLLTLAIERAKESPQPQREQGPVTWQTIETAPNGRIVLVHYKNRLGNGRTVRARYYLPETLESDATETGWADEGWYEESEAYEYLMPLEHQPTHWMPLPSAPGTAPQPQTKQEPWNPNDTANRIGGLPQEFIKHEVDSPDGWSEWVCPDPDQYFMKCCDCGLVHEMQFMVVKYSEGDECEAVDDPGAQAIFRARRCESAEKQERLK